MASGFIEADVSSTVTLDDMGGNGGSAMANFWGIITLTTHSTVGTKMDFPTAGVRWSHIEIILDVGGSAFTSLTAAVRVFFSWDSAGNDICAGPSANALLVPGQGDSTLAMTAIKLDIVPSLPPDGAANTVYCWISGFGIGTDTPVLKRARLHWHELSR